MSALQLVPNRAVSIRTSSSSRRAPRQRAAVVLVAAVPGPTAAAATAATAQSRRRQVLQAAALAAFLASQPEAAQALGFKKEPKRGKIPVEDYKELAAEPRLRYFELAPGQGGGPVVREGSRVTVHYDCKYRGIDVVSSRSARMLGGNRSVAEPYEFIAGEPVGSKKAQKVAETAGGLFAGSGGPKPPPALSSAVVGMHVGGKRSILVPAELGFGSKGEQEIPPNCESFELQIELLSVASV